MTLNTLHQCSPMQPYKIIWAGALDWGWFWIVLLFSMGHVHIQFLSHPEIFVHWNVRFSGSPVHLPSGMNLQTAYSIIRTMDASRWGPETSWNYNWFVEISCPGGPLWPYTWLSPPLPKPSPLQAASTNLHVFPNKELATLIRTPLDHILLFTYSICRK